MHGDVMAAAVGDDDTTAATAIATANEIPSSSSNTLIKSSSVVVGGDDDGKLSDKVFLTEEAKTERACFSDAAAATAVSDVELNLLSFSDHILVFRILVHVHDMHSLCQLACVCRRLRDLSSHSACWMQPVSYMLMSYHPGALLLRLRNPPSEGYKEIARNCIHLRSLDLMAHPDTSPASAKWRADNSHSRIALWSELRFAMEVISMVTYAGALMTADELVWIYSIAHNFGLHQYSIQVKMYALCSDAMRSFATLLMACDFKEESVSITDDDKDKDAESAANHVLSTTGGLHISNDHELSHEQRCQLASLAAVWNKYELFATNLEVPFGYLDKFHIKRCRGLSFQVLALQIFHEVCLTAHRAERIHSSFRVALNDPAASTTVLESVKSMFVAFRDVLGLPLPASWGDIGTIKSSASTLLYPSPSALSVNLGSGRHYFLHHCDMDLITAAGILSSNPGYNRINITAISSLSVPIAVSHFFKETSLSALGTYCDKQTYPVFGMPGPIQSAYEVHRAPLPPVPPKQLTTFSTMLSLVKDSSMLRHILAAAGTMGPSITIPRVCHMEYLETSIRFFLGHDVIPCDVMGAADFSLVANYFGLMSGADVGIAFIYHWSGKDATRTAEELRNKSTEAMRVCGGFESDFTKEEETELRRAADLERAAGDGTIISTTSFAPPPGVPCYQAPLASLHDNDSFLSRHAPAAAAAAAISVAINTMNSGNTATPATAATGSGGGKKNKKKKAGKSAGESSPEIVSDVQDWPAVRCMWRCMPSDTRRTFFRISRDAVDSGIRMCSQICRCYVCQALVSTISSEDIDRLTAASFETLRNGARSIEVLVSPERFLTCIEVKDNWDVVFKPVLMKMSTTKVVDTDAIKLLELLSAARRSWAPGDLPPATDYAERVYAAPLHRPASSSTANTVVASDDLNVDKLPSLLRLPSTLSSRLPVQFIGLLREEDALGPAITTTSTHIVEKARNSGAPPPLVPPPPPFDSRANSDPFSSPKSYIDSIAATLTLPIPGLGPASPPPLVRFDANTLAFEWRHIFLMVISYLFEQQIWCVVKDELALVQQERLIIELEEQEKDRMERENTKKEAKARKRERAKAKKAALSNKEDEVVAAERQRLEEAERAKEERRLLLQAKRRAEEDRKEKELLAAQAEAMQKRLDAARKMEEEAIRLEAKRAEEISDQEQLLLQQSKETAAATANAKATKARTRTRNRTRNRSRASKGTSSGSANGNDGICNATASPPVANVATIPDVKMEHDTHFTNVDTSTIVSDRELELQRQLEVLQKKLKEKEHEMLLQTQSSLSQSPSFESTVPPLSIPTPPPGFGSAMAQTAPFSPVVSGVNIDNGPWGKIPHTSAPLTEPSNPSSSWWGHMSAPPPAADKWGASNSSNGHSSGSAWTGCSRGNDIGSVGRNSDNSGRLPSPIGGLGCGLSETLSAPDWSAPTSNLSNWGSVDHLVPPSTIMPCNDVSKPKPPGLDWHSFRAPADASSSSPWGDDSISAVGVRALYSSNDTTENARSLWETPISRISPAGASTAVASPRSQVAPISSFLLHDGEWK